MVDRFLLVIAFELLVIVSMNLSIFIYFIFFYRAEKIKEKKEAQEKVFEEQEQAKELTNKIKQWDNLLNYSGREQKKDD